MFNIPQYETEQQWRRRIEQHLLLLDVDVKRLWGAVPQTNDQIGGFPMNPAVFQSSSSSSSSDSSGESSSESSSSGTGYYWPQCAIVTISGMSGTCEVLNGTWYLVRNGGGPSRPRLRYFQGDSETNVLIVVEYDPDAERWTCYMVGDGTPGTAVSEFGVPADWEGEFTYETGCEGSVSMTTSLEECPESSSSSSSSEPSSSSSSSSEESTSEASTSGGASSSGASSSEAPSSSSDESSGAPSSSSGASSTSGFVGEASNGETSEAGNSYTDPDCDGNVCATWQWISGNWERINFNPGACPVECATGCVETPKQSGYPGLYADVRCDGDIYYYEPA